MPKSINLTVILIPMCVSVDYLQMYILLHPVHVLEHLSVGMEFVCVEVVASSWMGCVGTIVV